uniref:Uncharacterized protein n=1 Tax=Aegilops tauschii subsp. strangulata TaxID=200361 RepID=A0A453SZC8_AEGTS
LFHPIFPSQILSDDSSRLTCSLTVVVTYCICMHGKKSLRSAARAHGAINACTSRLDRSIPLCTTAAIVYPLLFI